MKTVPQESSLTARNGKFDLKTSVEKHFMGLKYSVNRMTAEAEAATIAEIHNNKIIMRAIKMMTMLVTTIMLTMLMMASGLRRQSLNEI